MKQFFLFILVALLYTYVNTSDFDYDIDNFDSYANETNAECTKPGAMCKNCGEVVFCIKSGDKFTQIHLADCNATLKEYCLIDKCSTEPNPKCSGASAEDFVCHNTGVFPDPIECNIYHICIEKSDLSKEEDIPVPRYTIKCEDGYAYNPVTTYCDKKLVNGACPTPHPVPVCKTLGQMGAITGTSIYYICLEDEKKYLVANLYMCPHGTKFSNGSCT